MSTCGSCFNREATSTLHTLRGARDRRVRPSDSSATRSAQDPSRPDWAEVSSKDVLSIGDITSAGGDITSAAPKTFFPQRKTSTPLSEEGLANTRNSRTQRETTLQTTLRPQRNLSSLITAPASRRCDCARHLNGPLLPGPREPNGDARPRHPERPKSRAWGRGLSFQGRILQARTIAHTVCDTRATKNSVAPYPGR